MPPFTGRWHKKHLTYRIYSYSKDLGISATRTAIQTAFKYWSDVTQLTFQEVRTGRADIRLSFHGSSPWICSRSFDGPGMDRSRAGEEGGGAGWSMDEKRGGAAGKDMIDDKPDFALLIEVGYCKQVWLETGL